MRDASAVAQTAARGPREPAARRHKSGKPHRANMPRSVVSVNLRLTPVILNRYCTVRLIGC